jgi:hypothetical protein
MPAKSLPSSPNLDHLKHQARDLLADLKARNPEALSRMKEFHPKFIKRKEDERITRFSLADALLVVAREYGFESWPKLKGYVESATGPTPERPTLEQCEKVAQDLLEAFRTGEPRAMQNVWAYFGHRRTWETMRRYGKHKLCVVMSGVDVSNAGIPLFHEFPVFKTWQGGKPSMELLDYEAGPNYLGLRGPFNNTGLANLAGLDGLFALNVDDSKLSVTGPGLAPIVNLPNLGWLAFDAKNDAMAYIAAMPKLRFLMCQDTMAGDEGFVALSRSQSIEYIWGRRCHNLRARGFTALAAMPALRGLSVSCKNVDDEGLSALPRFPALKELMPMDVPDAGYHHVGRCQNLESLVLMYCRDTSDLATEHIAGLPKLKKYFASYTKITDRSMEILSRILSLEEISFYGCPAVTNAGVVALARLPRLRKLEVSGPKITSACATAFSPHVKTRFSDTV